MLRILVHFSVKTRPGAQLAAMLALQLVLGYTREINVRVTIDARNVSQACCVFEGVLFFSSFMLFSYTCELNRL